MEQHEENEAESKGGSMDKKAGRRAFPLYGMGGSRNIRNAVREDRKMALFCDVGGAGHSDVALYAE